MSQTRQSYGAEINARTRAIAARRFHRINRRILADRIRSVRGGEAEILEVGCGHLDFTLPYLRDACRAVVATDIERRFPEDIPLPDDVTFRAEDALNLTFSDASFDGVIALEVIEHVEDEHRFVSEALRVLRPDGQLIFTTPNRHRLTALPPYLIGRPRRFPYTYAEDPVLGPITHEREFSHRDLVELVARFDDRTAAARIHGIWLGVPAWDLGIVSPPPPLDRIAFNWHVVLTKR